MHQFDLFCTSTFYQIWTSYWSRSTGRSQVLVEVKFGRKSRSKVWLEVKSVGRSTEKGELRRTPKTFRPNPKGSKNILENIFGIIFLKLQY